MLEPLINQGLEIPKLFLMGTKDQFTSLTSFQSFISLISKNATSRVNTVMPHKVIKSVVVEGVDHFWGGFKIKLVEEIEQFIDQLDEPASAI